MLVALQFYMTYSKIPSSPKGDESMSTKYSAEFKKETIQRYEKGVSMGQSQILCKVHFGCE